MEMSECVFSCHFGKHDPLSHSNGSAPVLSKPIFSSFHIAEIPICLFLKQWIVAKRSVVVSRIPYIKTSWCFIIKTSWRSYVLSSSPFLNGFVWKLGTPKKPDDYNYTHQTWPSVYPELRGWAWNTWLPEAPGKPPLRWIWKATSHTGRYAAGLKIGDSCHDGFWWFMMVYEELSWFMKNYDGLWKNMMVYDGLSWFMGLKISFYNTQNPVNPWFLAPKSRNWNHEFSHSILLLDMGVSINGGWFIMENPTRWMRTGVPPWLRKPPLSVVSSLILAIWWGKTWDYHLILMIWWGNYHGDYHGVISLIFGCGSKWKT